MAYTYYYINILISLQNYVGGSINSLCSLNSKGPSDPLYTRNIKLILKILQPLSTANMLTLNIIIRAISGTFCRTLLNVGRGFYRIISALFMTLMLDIVGGYT